jgi:hypothetical protein
VETFQAFGFHTLSLMNFTFLPQSETNLPRATLMRLCRISCLHV